MKLTLPSIQTRQWIYRVFAAVFAILVAYAVITPDQVPLWLSLAAAVLGLGSSGMASVATGRQRKTGELEP